MSSSPASAPLPRWSSLIAPYRVAIDNRPMLAFRIVVVLCQAATFWITWPLWQARTSPPMLPAAPLPAFDMGWLLFSSLALVLVAPLPGLVLQTLLLLYAALTDQTRMQPEVVSLLFLLWGTLPSPTAKTFARVHLLSMWMFAGFHKLLSPTFMTETAPWLFTGFPWDPPPWLTAQAGVLIAGTELSVGLLSLIVRTRRVAAIVAFALHAGILLNLSPLGLNRNEAIWPWNVALALAGFALIAPWKESLLTSLRLSRPLARPLIVGLLIAPLGFYVGLVDAYLAHNLYSANTPRATVACPQECRADQDPYITWLALRVPPPPEHRVFEQYFARTCRPGDLLIIKDSREWFRWHGLDDRRLSCPDSS